MKALSLPRISRAEADAINARSKFRIPVVLPGADGFRLHLQAYQGETPRDALVTVRASFGDATAMVTLPRQLTTDLTQAMGNNIAADKLPPDVAALMLEVSIVNLLMVMEQAIDRPVRLLSLQDTPAQGNLGLPLTLEGPDNSWPLYVHSDADTLAFLIDRWPVGERDIEWLKMPLRFRAGVTTLSLPAIQSLRVGDVVLVETYLNAPGHLVLVAAERLCAICLMEEDRIQVAQAPERQGGGWLMSDDEEMGGGDMEDLPVRLAFDVGRLDMPLGEMRQLAAGTVLELGRAATGVVTISANGSKIGRGELVDVDGSLGVRIINIFSQDE